MDKRKRRSQPPLPALRNCELEGLSFKVARLPGAERRPCPTMAETLLARHAELSAGERVLIMPGGAGVLGVWAAGRTAQELVYCYDTSLAAAEAARRTLNVNRCERVNAEAALPTQDVAPFDAAFLTLPKGRDLARLLILAAARALHPGGRLYLAGANDEGIKSIVNDAAALLGTPEVLAFKGGNRIVRYDRAVSLPAELPDIYRTPGIEQGTFRTFTTEAGGESFTLHTRPGIFSWRELDAGTAILLDHLPVHPHDTALDLGCGYGVVGMWLARHTERGSVTLIDDDILAVASARRNLEANAITNAQVLLADGLEGLGRERFTLIASNPPFHSGREVSSAVTERWLQLAYQHLEPRGRLVIVANRFLPYNHVLDAVFGASETLYEDTRFRVLQAVKVYRKRGRAEAEESDIWDDEAENEALRSAMAERDGGTDA